MKIDKPIVRACVIVSLSIIGNITAKVMLIPLGIQVGMFSLVFIWLGYIFSKNTEIFNKVRGRYWFCLVVYLVAVYANCNISMASADATGHPLVDSLVAISSCFLLYSIVKKNKRCHLKLLQWIGRNSLFILCVHTLDMYVLKWLWWYELVHMGYTLTNMILAVFKILVYMGMCLLCERILGIKKKFAIQPI